MRDYLLSWLMGGGMMWLRTRAYWVALALLRYAARGSDHHYETKLWSDRIVVSKETYEQLLSMRSGLR